MKTIIPTDPLGVNRLYSARPRKGAKLRSGRPTAAFRTRIIGSYTYLKLPINKTTI